MTQSLPNFNLSDMNSPEGIFNIFGNWLMNMLQHSMPCIVESYDRKTNIAVLTPAINMALTTGEYVQRDKLTASVWCFGGGGYLMNLPLKKGDSGWLIGADKDTSLFKQTKSISNPNTKQKHKYTFGYFIPDLVNGFSISPEDNGNLVIQNMGGTEKISLGQNGTKLTSANLTISCPATTITGNVSVGGNVSVAGTMHSANYDAHTHTSTTAGSPTSPPDQ